MNWKRIEPKYNYNHDCIEHCVVGTFTITQPTVYRKYEETASRDHDIEVPAGVYSVTAMKRNGVRWHSLLIELPLYGTLQMYGYLLAGSEAFKPNEQSCIQDGNLVGNDGSIL